MDFLNKLFSKNEPDENDMQNYAASLITPTTLISPEKHESLLRRKYPKLSGEEIGKLINKSLEIFHFCENIPYTDEKFKERAKEQYPFLSKKALISLRGAVFYSQVK